MPDGGGACRTDGSNQRLRLMGSRVALKYALPYGMSPYTTAMSQALTAHLAQLLGFGEATETSRAQATQLVQEAKTFDSGNLSAAAKLMRNILACLQQNDPGRGVSVSHLARTCAAVFHLAGQEDVDSLTRDAMALASREGRIKTNCAKGKVATVSLREFSPPPATWRVPALPESLVDLAEYLESKGGEAAASDIDKELMRPASQILSRHKKNWNVWIEQHIGRPRRGVYRLN